MKKDKPTKDKSGITGILRNGNGTETKADAKSKVKTKLEKVTTEAISSEDEADEDDEESEIDDQTETLLRGFESEEDDANGVNEGGLKPGQDIPKVPDVNNQSRKQLKRMKESEDPERPGVIYVGRIPHGFYENEMRAYFNQFGNILKLRLSRNRKTGQSKHYAWIQFESATVAEIVAKTMDNYLLFNHILKVKIVPDEQVPENLFKGANKRFKKVPWNKMEGRKLEQGASEETWEKRIEKEVKQRGEKAKKLKDFGYEFESPKIKSAKGVSKRPAVKDLTANGEGGAAPEAIEAASVVEDSEQHKKKKEKKSKRNEIFGVDITESAQILAAKEVKEAERAKKKEEQKAKAAEEASAVESTAPVEPKTKKRNAEDTGNENSGKKEKKQKKDKAVVKAKKVKTVA